MLLRGRSVKFRALILEISSLPYKQDVVSTHCASGYWGIWEGSFRDSTPIPGNIHPAQVLAPPTTPVDPPAARAAAVENGGIVGLTPVPLSACESSPPRPG